MLLKVLPLIVLAACGDNLPPCESATTYLGPMVPCQGIDGVCISAGAGQEPECRPRCATDGPACLDGEWWRTIVVTDDAGDVMPPVCYCEPSPTAHLSIVRDHRR